MVLVSLQRSLRILNLSSCHVTSAAPLAMLRALEQLDLSKNGISDLEDVFTLLSSLSALTELDLRTNPVTNTPKYREKAITFSSSRLGPFLRECIHFPWPAETHSVDCVLIPISISTALLDKKDIDANQRRMMQSHLAHKFRKRQDAAPERSAADSSGSANNLMNETRRTMKHGSAVHQLRNMPISSTGVAKNAKAQFEREGFSVEGASCSSTTTMSSALVRSALPSNNNNKHH